MPGCNVRSSTCRSLAERWSLAVVALALLPTGCGDQKGKSAPTAVRVMEVRASKVARQARYSANILPATRVDLLFKVGGYVEFIMTKEGRLLSEGDRVEKGDLLARVKAGEVTEKLGEVRALASGAAAQADAAKQEFERARTLFERGVISKSQFDGARMQYRAATAQVEAASAGGKQVRSVIGDTTLRAPISGVVLKRLIEVGSLVGPGVPGFVIADTTQVKASFGVPDTMLEALKLGSPISVTIEALPGRALSGAISRIAPSADPTTRVFEIETTIPNPDDTLKTGMVASVSLGEDDAPSEEVLLPLQAVVRSPVRADGFATYVVDKEGPEPTAALREVELGEIYQNYVPARAGLKPGELVVVMGAGLLSPGDRVAIIPDESGTHAQ